MSKRKFHQLKEIRITAEGWIFLTVLGFISVGAVLRNVNLLILMAGMMFAPLIINWRLGVLWLKTLSAKRTLPYQVHAGQFASVHWLCRNDAKISAWSIEIRDHLINSKSMPDPGNENSTEPDRHGWLHYWSHLKQLIKSKSILDSNFNAKIDILQIGPQRTAAGSYRVFFTQRGQYRVGPALLATRFPFGLVYSRILITEPARFFVAPAIGTLTPTWERRIRSSAIGADAVQRRRGLEEDEFYALRPWRSGDSRKQIHWRSTAKFGHPIVKQHEQPDNRDFALLLDLHISSDGGDDELAIRTASHCETALSFATTVLLHLGTAVQGRIALAICGQSNAYCRSRNHRELVDQAMRELAIAEPAMAPNLVHGLLELANAVSAGTPLYVISSRERAIEISCLESEFNETPTDSVEGGFSPANIRQLKAIWPAVRWMTVDSRQFEELFTENGGADRDKLRDYAAKWSTLHAAR